MQKSHVFGLRTSRNPQNRQIGHYRYVWGQSRSMTSDDLWKVKMQCQRSYVVLCLPKSCIISSFLLMAASYVAENTISLKKSVRGCTSYDVIAPWPGLTRLISFCQKLHRGCPISYAKFQRDPPSGSEVIPEKLMDGGCINPPCTGEG